MKITSFLFTALSSLALMACGGPASNNGANARNTNSTALNSNAAAITPPPFTTPAAGDNSNAATAYAKPAAPGSKPTPVGTPATSNSKATKPGATPTPGIPSPEEMKRIMSGNPKGDPNQPPPAMQGQPMMKSKPLGGRMSNNSNHPE